MDNFQDICEVMGEEVSDGNAIDNIINKVSGDCPRECGNDSQCPVCGWEDSDD